MDPTNDEKTVPSPVMVTEEVPQAEAESAPEAKAEETVAEASAPEAPKEDAETVDAPKKGAQSRIKELVSEKKQAEERAQSLEERVAELTGRVDQAPQAQYTPQVEPGQELTQDQYKQDVLKTAQAMVDIRVKQSESVSRITSEVGQTVRKYPQLDPESDQFDKELSDSVTEATLAYVKAEPYTASPKKFVEKMMKPYLRSVTKEVGKATENIARQVSETALRPTAVSTKGDKLDKDKSVKELEAELGIQQY